MVKSVDIDSKELSKILGKLFPMVRFPFPPENWPSDWAKNWLKKMDIYNLIQKNKIDYTKMETLVWAMMQSEIYGNLFPKDAQREWEDLEKSIQAEEYNVMCYFIKNINKEFIRGFNNVVQGEIKRQNSVLERFYKILNGKTFLPNEFGNPKSMNICEHSPSSFYKAFEYYAHKQYTLIRLGMQFPVEELHKKWKSDLEEKLKDRDIHNNYLGLEYFYIDFLENYETVYTEIKENNSSIDLALEIIDDLFVKELVIKDKKTKSVIKSLPFFMYNVKIMIDKRLESTPKTYSTTPYEPTDFITLTGQISGQIGYVIKEKDDPDKKDLDDADRHNIRNYWEILRENLMYEKDRERFEECDNNFEKVKMLYDKIRDSDDNYYRKLFGDKIHTIEALYKKISYEFTLIENLDSLKKNEGSITIIPHASVVINDFIRKEFDTDADEEFIKSILEEGRGSIFGDTFVTNYYKKSDTLKFSYNYSEGQKNDYSKIFAHRLKKALKKYEEAKEEKNGIGA
jgi:hypothetical protein